MEMNIRITSLHFRISGITMHLVLATGLDAISGNIYVNTLLASAFQSIGFCIGYPILKSPLGRTGTMFATCLIIAILVSCTILFQDGVYDVAYRLYTFAVLSFNAVILSHSGFTLCISIGLVLMVLVWNGLKPYLLKEQCFDVLVFDCSACIVAT